MSTAGIIIILILPHDGHSLGLNLVPHLPGFTTPDATLAGQMVLDGVQSWIYFFLERGIRPPVIVDLAQKITILYT